MRLKNVVKTVIFALLCVILFYVGGCFLGTFTKALTQPHLEGMGRTWNFMGFYIMAGFYAIIFIILAAVIILSLVYMRKKRKNGN